MVKKLWGLEKVFSALICTINHCYCFLNDYSRSKQNLIFFSSFMIGGLNRFQTGGTFYRKSLFKPYCEENQIFLWHFGHLQVLGMSLGIIWVAQGTRHSPSLLIVVYVRVILGNHLTPAHHEPRERIHDPHCHPQASPHLSQHLLFKPFECWAT